MSMRATPACPLAWLVSLFVLLAGLTAIPLSPATAVPPGSIVFIKNYNIWISDSAGRNARPVTTNGFAAVPWTSPTQSDSGIIAASRGALIYRLTQFGAVLNSMDPPNLGGIDPVGGHPTSLAISPDGSKIAYTYSTVTSEGGRVRTSYTDAGRLTPPSKYGYTEFDHPSWVTNSRTLQDGGRYQHINLHDLGSMNITYWFDDDDVFGGSWTALNDAELSRDGSLLAMIRGESAHTALVWVKTQGAQSGGRPPMPTTLCDTNDVPGIASPTWAPDSSALAWQEPDGIWIKRDPLNCSVQPQLVILGASAPAWSKAAMQPVRKFSISKKPRITGTAKKGRTLKASRGTWSPSASSYTYRWYRDGRAISKATRSTYKIASKDRKHRISVRVTARRSGYVTKEAASAAVRIKR